MGRLSVCGVLSLLAFLLGFTILGIAMWTVTRFHASVPQGDGFGAGIAYFGTYGVGVIGIAVIGFALVISPARADGGGVVTIGRRQRQVSGAGLTVLVVSLAVPLVAIRVVGIVDTILVWLGLVAVGTVQVAVAFVWTVAEAALIRAGVVG